ncbi:MAG: glycosyltransferase family 2 protein [Candidatus Bathyarchaeota archaeon]|nr:glycosyltransferase family 2 protein [Candidatus Bathyarchaeota archaeon]
MKEQIDISIVIPVYQGEETVRILITRLDHTIGSLDLSYEIILVDDGSRDDSWRIIKEEVEGSKFIKGIKLSRNFGQHNAISAGLAHALGERVVVMDCDLQDLPEEISKLYRKSLEGYDIVVGQRIKRSDAKAKIWTSKIFYRVFNRFTGLKFEPGIGNFGIYSSRSVNSVLMFKETFRPFPIIVRIIGFNRIGIEVEHGRRMSGESNYTGFSLLKGALNTIIYYSNKPMWIFMIAGIGMVAFVFFLVVGIFFLTFEISTLQLVFALIILLSCVSLNIAVIGLYVSRIFIEIKKRPAYIVEEIIK